jgi:hypothetical protein
MPRSAIRLLELDKPAVGMITARVEGEPSFSHVQGLSDAIMAAVTRGVDLIIPNAMYAEIRDDLPPDLPDFVKVE